MRRYATIAWVVTAVLGAGAAFAAPKAPKPPKVCGESWTIGGTGKGEEIWQKPGGYRIGMSKMQASSVNRGGMRSSLAQDSWSLVVPSARIGLVFEKGALATGRFTLQVGDYQKARSDLVRILGEPAETGSKHTLWRSEECSTVKMLLDEGTTISLVIESLDYHARKSQAAQ
jgi:hypothetical protein